MPLKISSNLPQPTYWRTQSIYSNDASVGVCNRQHFITILWLRPGVRSGSLGDLRDLGIPDWYLCPLSKIIPPDAELTGPILSVLSKCQKTRGWIIDGLSSETLWYSRGRARFILIWRRGETAPLPPHFEKPPTPMFRPEILKIRFFFINYGP